MSAKPKIVYYPARGRAELARLCLSAAGVEWDEEHVNPEKMAKLKEGDDLVFGQVPLLEDNGLQIVQSMAIARYLARKYDLLGSLEQAVVADMIIDGWSDAINKIIPLLYPTPNTDGLAEYKKNSPKVFAPFEKLLKKHGGSGGWASGDSFSFADCALYAVTEFAVDQELFDAKAEIPLLFAHYVKVKEESPLKTYLASDKRFPNRKYF